MSLSKKPEDPPLGDYQIRLLDLAFQAASAIPVPPFSKDRSLAQEAVVTACLKLDQPIRAVRWADQIEDWRRGLCYANTAYYLAERGYGPEHIQPGLNLAEQIARGDHGQSWRSDRIRARIAQAKLAAGMTEQADPLGQDLEESESAVLLETRIMTEQNISFDEQVKHLEVLAALLNFDITQGVLHAFAGLFDRYYDDPVKRSAAEEKIKAFWGKMPIPVRLEVLKKMASSALDHRDSEKALSIVQEAQEYLEGFSLPLEKHIFFSAEFIQLRYKAKDTEQAKIHADSLLNLYEEKGSGIIDIYRAEALSPLAEAYCRMGYSETGLSVYKKAVEAGMTNPNPAPRAEDLSAICCSMALAGIEPDAELWARIDAILSELGPK